LSSPRTLRLVAPDWSRLDTIWRHPLPFVLWPVCGKTLLGHWLDAAIGTDPAEIVIECPDRPHLVRTWLGKGNYWSKPLTVVSDSSPGGEGERWVMDSLPGLPPAEPPADGAAVLARWHALHERALQLREEAPLQIDRELAPGVWLAPGAQVDPTARCTGPCWIGPRAQIGPRCRVGPRAYIGAESVIEDDVEIEDAVICAQTFVGRHTRLHRAAAQGGLLLDWGRGVAVQIHEDFILASLRRPAVRPRLTERLVAAVLRLLLFPLARLWNAGTTPRRDAVVVQGAPVVLTTWPRGWLIVRRESWLGEVAAGRMRLLGVLPRGDAAWNALPEDVRHLLAAAPAGVLSLADLFDCHSAAEPDEWMHAAFQIGSPDGAGRRQLRRAAWKLAFKDPVA
jgi:hypothetical protein